MNTPPINDRAVRGECAVERVDDRGNTRLCAETSRFVWHVAPGTNIQVCRLCKDWLETLESLGQRIV